MISGLRDLVTSPPGTAPRSMKNLAALGRYTTKRTTEVSGRSCGSYVGSYTRKPIKPATTRTGNDSSNQWRVDIMITVPVSNIGGVSMIDCFARQYTIRNALLTFAECGP